MSHATRIRRNEPGSESAARPANSGPPKVRTRLHGRMMMRMVRILLLSIALCAAAAAALAIATGSGSTELGILWHGAAPESLNLAQAVTQRYLHPAVWTRGMLPLLLMPAAPVFMSTAAVALVLYLATLLFKRGRIK